MVEHQYLFYPAVIFANILSVNFLSAHAKLMQNVSVCTSKIFNPTESHIICINQELAEKTSIR